MASVRAWRLERHWLETEARGPEMETQDPGKATDTAWAVAPISVAAYCVTSCGSLHLSGPEALSPGLKEEAQALWARVNQPHTVPLQGGATRKCEEQAGWVTCLRGCRRPAPGALEGAL